MNKSIVRNCYITFLALLVMSLIGCAPKRVHKSIEVKENIAVHRPLVRLKPLKKPTVDDPSRTLDYYAKLKTKGRIVRRSRSIPSVPKAGLGPVSLSDSAIEVRTPYQARLAPGWESNGLKYLSIDGLQYSRREILVYSKRSDSSSPFSRHQGGVLLIKLDKSFKLELAFYPPKTKGHEDFKEFKLHVYSEKGKAVHKEFVNKRLQIYTVEK